MWVCSFTKKLVEVLKAARCSHLHFTFAKMVGLPGDWPNNIDETPGDRFNFN